MPSPFHLFSTASPIGPDIGAPRRGVRRQIADIIALVDGPPESAGGFDGPEDIFRTIRKFQSRLNLKPDGVVKPGGPTESALNAFAVANEKGGPRLAEAIKPAIADLTKQGLTFTPDPRNPESLGMWRNNKGHRVEPDRAGNLLHKIGPGSPDLDGKQQLFAERLVGKTGRDKMMAAGGTDVPAAAESGAAAAVPGGDSLQGGGGQDTLKSATGDVRPEQGEQSGSGATSVDPFEGLDGGDNASASAQPSSQPPMNDGVPKDGPEAVGVPGYLKDVHRERVNDLSNEDALMEKRDADGKIIRPGVPPSTAERNKSPEFTSVMNGIRVASDMKSNDAWKLIQKIRQLPNARPGDRRLLEQTVRMMRGDVPSNGRLERALSDKELRARKERFSNRSARIGGSAIVGGLAGAAARANPLSGAALGIVGMGAALDGAKGRASDAELETRRKERGAARR